MGRIEAVDVAAGRHHGRVAHHIVAGRGRHKPAAQTVQQPRQLVVGRQAREQVAQKIPDRRHPRVAAARPIGDKLPHQLLAGRLDLLEARLGL